MDRSLIRGYLAELVGTMLLVYFAAGAVCVQQMTTPLGQPTSLAPISGHQPGLVGVAIVYGLTWAILASATASTSGGYLNPALTLMLWIFRRIDSLKLSWLIGAQLLGAAFAGLLLRNTFDPEILKSVRFATPHISSLVYPGSPRLPLATGVGLEFALTFLVTVGIFAAGREGSQRGLFGGLALTAGALVLFPLTGAAGNPARWFGPCCWEAFTMTGNAWNDAVVYLAGPILGALFGGWFSFKLLDAK